MTAIDPHGHQEPAAFNTTRPLTAREVLEELATELHNDGDHQMGRYVERWRDKHYPAPAPPVTVTVMLVDREWKRYKGGYWVDAETGMRPNAANSDAAFDRIAADARVIAAKDARLAAVERERDEARASLQLASDNTRLWRERDEARRALEAATSQGEGTGATPKGAPESEAQATGSLREAPPSPAPIPLDAVVSDGRTAWRYLFEVEGSYWESVGTKGIKRYAYRGESNFQSLCALYRALHPVATPELVERVAKTLQRQVLSAMTWEQRAEQILRAAGYTIQEDGR